MNVNDYIESLPEDRKAAMEELRKTINKNIPKGFQETISYGMMGWVVPHSKYPAGYHCDPKLPLPFLAVASQKNFRGYPHVFRTAEFGECRMKTGWLNISTIHRSHSLSRTYNTLPSLTL